MTKHVMLDIETWGTKPYSAIIGIGAAYFDPTGTPGAMLDTFHVTIDPELAQAAGFQIDASTVSWWLHPNQRSAWDKFLGTAHFAPQDAFNGFGQWLDTIGPREDIKFWGNGAGFDCNLMHNAAKVLNIGYTNEKGEGRDGLWPHWNDRCFRTLKNMSYLRPVVVGDENRTPTIKAKDLQPKFAGTPHVAVDDAIHQAHWLQAICNQFNLELN
jgi:exodeoxyribonuclease VIII